MDVQGTSGSTFSSLRFAGGPEGAAESSGAFHNISGWGGEDEDRHLVLIHNPGSVVAREDPLRALYSHQLLQALPHWPLLQAMA